MSQTRFKFLTYGDDPFPIVSKNFGGPVYGFLANSNLNLGDLVGFTNVANTVDKSATAATVGNVFAGVVVGGDLTGYKPLDWWEAPATGTIAVATAGKIVLVQTDGICKMRADGAIATIGGRLIGGTTAGLALAGTTAGAVVGVNLEAGVNLNLFKAFIMRR
jgi:hypothetical protein